MKFQSIVVKSGKVDDDEFYLPYLRIRKYFLGLIPYSTLAPVYYWDNKWGYERTSFHKDSDMCWTYKQALKCAQLAKQQFLKDQA